jgi:hypothetical protein
MTTTKQELKDLLKKKIVSVTFVKTDKTERKMLCTLKENVLPVVESKEPKRTKKDNDNVLAVWDLEKEAFRSFRVDSVTDYQVVTEGYEL